MAPARARIAIVLAVLAALSVLGTAALALATYAGRGGDAAAEPVRTVRDRASGATLTVPADGWRVHGRDRRVSYGGAHVLGAAVLDEGYCRDRPAGSFRAVAGFTGQSFETWVHGVAGGAAAWSSGTRHQRVVLADGTQAELWHVGLLLGRDTCSSGAVDLAMVRAGDVRVVVVADTGGQPGTLDHLAVDEIARSLELP